MLKKQYAVIGLGRFGSSVAAYLTGMGYEVLAVDDNEERVQDIVHQVTHAVSADSTDEEAMKALGIRNFDVVVVAIGQDIQASIMTTLIVKELGVPHIVVKAQNDMHGKVLSKIGADKVVFPERDMGLRVAHHLISPNILEHIELSGDFSIVEMKAPPAFVNKNLKQLDFRAKFGCNVLAVKRGEDMDIAPRADAPLLQGDVLVIVGKNERLMKLEQTYAEG
ncbi:potassium channel family protein [Cohnella faecalis]|uniref:TrkA family potassium uptake protein n=1 Tax=Cohnella faecalis TaxID=2315694 RepID=A0A398CKN8_9BACL|nr:TrkA family potassium uptake protein [Cohnella faecalis]RIE02699.1 TrkA family potassium uptake protein [Cohnella faecalis]RIE02712.1 TrkA family potassium uptake protein [Cohnella faecalis]